MRTVYLAGPAVFRPDAHTHGEALKRLCAEFGLTGIHPLDSDVDLTGPNPAQAICAANLAFIRACDGMVADMSPFRGPGMDAGTAFEMGFALALGKPVIGYGVTDAYAERVRALCGELRRSGPFLIDADGLVVEDFGLPDNLMMACAATAIVADAYAALAELARRL